MATRTRDEGDPGSRDRVRTLSRVAVVALLVAVVAIVAVYRLGSTYSQPSSADFAEMIALVALSSSLALSVAGWVALVMGSPRRRGVGLSVALLAATTIVPLLVLVWVARAVFIGSE